MTLKEFIEQTAHMDPNTDLFVAPRRTEFALGLVNSLELREINMSEDPNGEGESATQIAIILDEY